jgi:hypothetical protein
VKYERRCPRCGRGGSLFVQYGRWSHLSKWSGPYFMVRHTMRSYSHRKYHARTKRGVAPEEARGVGAYVRGTSWNCYFGHVYPKRLSVAIPEPP